MVSARDDILATIRRSLGVSGKEATRKLVVEDRLERAPKGILPGRGQVSGKELIDVFETQAEASFAVVTRVASSADVPQSVAGYLRDHNLPAAVRMGEDMRLRVMPWEATALEISRGRSEGSDLNSVSFAFGAVAESGTVVLVSGADNPSTLNFLPDTHIVVVQAKDIARDYESVWSKIRFAYGKGSMPRTVNWITGPSRSGDIEQTMLLGAHGPRRLHIVIVEE